MIHERPRVDSNRHRQNEETDVVGLVVVPWVYSPKKDIPKM